MENNGIPKRIQKKVIELVKCTGCWDPELDFGDAVEIMANFCIKNKKELEKWKKKNK
jgi:hypothetical protein